MVITYLFKCKLFPGQKSSSPDLRTTDDKFLIEIESDDENKISSILKKTGATEINVKLTPEENAILQSLDVNQMP